MRELGLFAGAGGGLLASRLLGWDTVCAVEIDEHCQRVLAQRQRDGMLEPFPIWDDIRTFDGRPWAGCIDVVSGGFPCQDISSAGRGAGLAGDRSGLWFEMLRVIGEVRPAFVFAENARHCLGRGISLWVEAEAHEIRVVDGVADRVDRVRAAGNGQVPAVAALAWRVLSDALSASL